MYDYVIMVEKDGCVIMRRTRVLKVPGSVPLAQGWTELDIIAKYITA